MVKTNTVKKAAIGFGAAAASIYAAPELMASIETITFSPGSVAFTSSSTAVNVAMDTVGGDVGTFSQYNDSVGKSFMASGGLGSFAVVSAGVVLNTSTFSGSTSSIAFSTGATGTVYVGFRATSANGGGVGWFSMDLGGSAGDIVYGTAGGQYGNNGESVTVGQSPGPGPGDVPELGSAYGVGLLAMGAIGIRRRRREAQK